MKARFSHIALKVSSQPVSRDFYAAALAPLGFVVADEVPGHYARLTNREDIVIVLSEAETSYAGHGYHRRRVGLHHFALALDSREVVDVMADHLAACGIALAGGGRAELDYRGGYYSLLFEDPDRILIELAFHAPAYFGDEPNG